MVANQEVIPRLVVIHQEVHQGHQEAQEVHQGHQEAQEVHQEVLVVLTVI
jgi:hypothetical protein